MRHFLCVPVCSLNSDDVVTSAAAHDNSTAQIIKHLNAKVLMWVWVYVNLMYVFATKTLKEILKILQITNYYYWLLWLD